MNDLIIIIVNNGGGGGLKNCSFHCCVCLDLLSVIFNNNLEQNEIFISIKSKK
jgi:hypothetical protein